MRTLVLKSTQELPSPFRNSIRKVISLELMTMISKGARVIVNFIALHLLSCSLASLVAQQSPQDSAAKAKPDDQSTSSRLKETITHLSQTIGERNLHRYAKLTDAANYVSERFEKIWIPCRTPNISSP